MRAFHYGAISVVKCMVEFHQLRHPVADSDQRTGLDVGLAVVEGGFSVQEPAVNGTLDAVLALPDDGAGIGIQDCESGRRKADRRRYAPRSAGYHQNN